MNSETLPSSSPEPRTGWKSLLFILIVAGGGLSFYFTQGKTKATPVAHQTTQVAVTKVTRSDLAEELAVEAEFRPYQEIDLHAKVTGYLEKIGVDVGDRVKEDQLLATLEVPEQQNELEHAQAVVSRCQEEIKRAQASYDEAHLAFTRLESVNKAQPKLIAQQDLDEARAKDRNVAATVAAAVQQLRVAEADVKKLKTMLAYARITAPFAGVITKRGADPGALIQAGTSGKAAALVQLSQMDKLRLAFPISASYVARVKEGDLVDVQVPALGKVIAAKVSRITRKLETATRTMEAEVDVANPDLTILPGMYATAVLKLNHREKVLTIPVEAVSHQPAPNVFLVNNGRVEERRIKLGLETPHRVEVVEGLNENDLVVFGSRAQVAVGQTVETKLVEASR
jgi:RND family efflux transporter MFP subunit